MMTAISRRTFVKTGLIGALALAAAGGLYRATRSPAVPGPFILDADGKSALTAIAAVMLKNALPSASPQAVEAEIARVLGAISGWPRITQAEIQDLFGLLTIAPGRRLLAGISGPWSKAQPEEIAAFLQSWRLHRIDMLQSAYCHFSALRRHPFSA